jgi:glutamine synthetase
VIPGSEKSQRVEYRIAAADCNPYIALPPRSARPLRIEHKIEPTKPIVGNSYEMKHPAKFDLPRRSGKRRKRLKKSTAARELFGDEFVEHHAATREWEEREFRKAITDWELAGISRSSENWRRRTSWVPTQKTITPVDNSVYVDGPKRRHKKSRRP